jgi:hypothetical protein
MKYTQSILVACTCAAVLASARPAGGATHKHSLSGAVHKFGKVARKSAAIAGAVHNELAQRDLEELDTRDAGRIHGGGHTHREGHGAHGAHAAHGAHGTHSHRSSRGHGGAGGSEEQPAARDFEEDDLLFLRDLIDELEERSVAGRTSGSSSRARSSSSRTGGSARKTEHTESHRSQAHKEGSAASRQHASSRAGHSASGAGHSKGKGSSASATHRHQGSGESAGHRRQPQESSRHTNRPRDLFDIEDELDLRSFDDFEIDELD